MRNKGPRGTKRVATTILAALLAALLLAPVARAEQVGTASFPGTSGAIAFISERDGFADVYVMRLAPEGPRNVPVKLTRNTRPNPEGPPYMNDFSPDWSPDGARIAFASDRSGNFEVYRMKASPEGRLNKPVNLSKNPAGDQDPAWSPAGKKLAFSTYRDDNWEIYRMRSTDGANPTNLTNNPALDLQPAWQPLP